MLKKIVIISILFASIIFFSGCVDDAKNSGNNSDNQIDDPVISQYENIPRTNLPPGITFLDVHETEVEIGNYTRNAIEGIYRTDVDDDEVYVQIINDENPSLLIDEFKSYYKEANYNPFTEITINGHNATQVTYYRVEDGKQIAKHTIIWATKKSMIKVGGSVDAMKLVSLSSATGS